MFPLLTKSLIFALILAASAFAQTEKPPAEPKVSFVYWSVFEDKKAEINELVAAHDKLEVEFQRR